MSKFFVTQIPADAVSYTSEDSAIEAAKAASQASAGTTFAVVDEKDTVVTPLPEAVVTKVE